MTLSNRTGSREAAAAAAAAAGAPPAGAAGLRALEAPEEAEDSRAAARPGPCEADRTSTEAEEDRLHTTGYEKVNGMSRTPESLASGTPPG